MTPPPQPDMTGMVSGLDWVARLLQATDSAYPTGSYAHSFGLEGLCAAGMLRDLEGLRAFLTGQVLGQLAACELPVASRAWEASGVDPDWGRLEQLCFLGSSMRGSREPREASEAVGRQRIAMAALLHKGLAQDFQDRAQAGGWPVPSCVAAGVEGRALGIPRDALLASLAYSTLTGLVAAAVKLLRLGQNACQLLLRDLMALVPSCIARALALADDELGYFNPWLDIAASRHETAEFRLFIS